MQVLYAYLSSEIYLIAINSLREEERILRGKNLYRSTTDLYWVSAIGGGWSSVVLCACTRGGSRMTSGVRHLYVGIIGGTQGSRGPKRPNRRSESRSRDPAVYRCSSFVDDWLLC